jgi:1D-myo-inositol 3-kinase
MRFVAVGHVTNDRIDGKVVAGGSALYAGLTARALGAEAEIITSHAPDWVGSTDLPMRVVPARRTTTFEHVYEGGRRRSWLRSVAAPLEGIIEADIVFLCPVAGEVDAAGRGLVGAGLQGWLRHIDPAGEVSTRPLEKLPEADVYFASTHDISDPPDVPLFLWTDGARGVRVGIDGTFHVLPAAPAHEVDPTGAGDVFAAAFLVALYRTRDPLHAAKVAARAAAIAVEGVGTSALLRLTPIH